MIVTRFAPSPTGYLHVGNLRTAVMNWMLARQGGGRFILRLDDTDAERSTDAFAEAIRVDLAWVGIDWDAEARQSARLGDYADAAERLKAAGRLYECFETPQELSLRRAAQRQAGRPPVYDRAALGLSEAERTALRAERPSHWRFRLDPGRVEWEDGILGAMSVDAESLSDPVLIRGDGQVLYTLASVVDDAQMEVSDVVRGADHVTNTAVQVQLFAALGADAPRFAHHSLLTGAEGEALSKREGALSLRDLRDEGVEPGALRAMIARLGTGEAAGAEAVPFELARFGAAPTKFDAGELRAASAKYLHGCEYAEMAEDLRAVGVPDVLAPAFWEAVHGNVARRGEIAEWWAICRDGAVPVIAAEDAEFVRDAWELLPPRPWDAGTWGAWTGAVKAASGRKGRGLFMPLRQALTGRSHGPEMAALMPLLQAPVRREDL